MDAEMWLCVGAKRPALSRTGTFVVNARVAKPRVRAMNYREELRWTRKT